MVETTVETKEPENTSLTKPESFRVRLFNKVLSCLPSAYIYEPKEACNINTAREARITAIMTGIFCGAGVGMLTGIFANFSESTPLIRSVLMTYTFTYAGSLCGVYVYKLESKRVNRVMLQTEAKKQVLPT